MSRRIGAGLSRERVLQAALNLVDHEGVDALTMRRLGRELGVEAMSLYGYVNNKQDLLDGLLERIYDELPRTVGATDRWQDQVRTTAQIFRQVLWCHPDTVGLVAAHPVPSRDGLELLDSAATALQEAGLDAPRAGEVVTVVLSFTIGHTANEIGDANRIPRDEEFGLGLDFIIAGVEGLLDHALAPS
jgi:TetR/AcrR family transcriptional regulator, tetracycline repressor protein